VGNIFPICYDSATVVGIETSNNVGIGTMSDAQLIVGPA
jgi:hypothetical protein